MKIVIYEDDRFRQFYPLTLTRPIFNLKTGIFSFAERIIRQYHEEEVILYVRNELAEISRSYYPRCTVNPPEPPDQALWLNGRCLTEKALEFDHQEMMWASDKMLCAAFLKKHHAHKLVNANFTNALQKLSSLPEMKYPGAVFSHTWELIERNRLQVAEDAKYFTGHWGNIDAPGIIVEDRNLVYVHPNAKIRIGTVLETENGPILIDEDARVEAGAVIKGPVYIGKHSIVTSLAVIREGVTLGPWSKIGGEVSTTIFQGFTNKPHAGFLGNSYLGEWCNLGAGTDTSNLKNNYSTVRAWSDGRFFDTGLQFLGLTMGDHSKAAIGTKFNTGTVVGVGSNIFHHGFPPKYIPSFIWGGNTGSAEHQIDAMIETGKRVMMRRNMTMPMDYEKLLAQIFVENNAEREQFFRENNS